MNTSTRLLITAAAVSLALATGVASARAGGSVLQIDGDDIYIDLGAADGVGAGSQLTLMNVVIATDPISKEQLRDRFPIGKLTVVKAGEHLCIATAPKKIAHRVTIGDEVELHTPERAFVDPWQLQVANSKRRKPIDHIDEPDAPEDDPAAERIAAQLEVDAAEAVRAAWNATLGRDVPERIVIWQEYLAVAADSPYVGAVQTEIQSLRGQMKAAELAAQSQRDPDLRRSELRVDRLRALEPNLNMRGPLVVRAPDRVYEGMAVELAFTILDAEAVDRAWLYYRTGGEKTYERVALTHDGDAYLRATIPASVATPPRIEYFVEVAADAGEPTRGVGDESLPERVEVDARVEETPSDIADRSRVTLFADYVDFDGKLGKGFDQYFHAEIDFMYRFYKPIYSLRVGFGTMGGVGGPKDVIDEDPANACRRTDGTYACRRVAYNYAYTEVEMRYSDAIAFMIRPQLGTGTSDRMFDSDANRCDRADVNDPNCEFFSSFGLRARVRFGDEKSTNLILGFSVTEDVGNLFEAAYAWSVIPDFPVILTAQVTTQPVPEDAGVRLIADVGWRALDWVYPSVRIAYQARDVDHAGLSGGMAANFDW